VVGYENLWSKIKVAQFPQSMISPRNSSLTSDAGSFKPGAAMLNSMFVFGAELEAIGCAFSSSSSAFVLRFRRVTGVVIHITPFSIQRGQDPFA
jgi:hypothetical protein